LPLNSLIRTCVENPKIWDASKIVTRWGLFTCCRHDAFMVCVVLFLTQRFILGFFFLLFLHSIFSLYSFLFVVSFFHLVFHINDLKEGLSYLPYRSYGDTRSLNTDDVGIFFINSDFLFITWMIDLLWALPRSNKRVIKRLIQFSRLLFIIYYYIITYNKISQGMHRDGPITYDEVLARQLQKQDDENATDPSRTSTSLKLNPLYFRPDLLYLIYRVLHCYSNHIYIPNFFYLQWALSHFLH
jgi:hypothetical protein